MLPVLVVVVLLLMTQFANFSGRYFTLIPNDNLRIIRLFLTNQERCTLFRAINQKCNAVHQLASGPMTRGIQRFHALTNRLARDSIVGFQCIDSVRWSYIQMFHQTLRFEEQHIVRLPQIINSWSTAIILSGSAIDKYDLTNMMFNTLSRNNNTVNHSDLLVAKTSYFPGGQLYFVLDSYLSFSVTVPDAAAVE